MAPRIQVQIMCQLICACQMSLMATVLVSCIHGHVQLKRDGSCAAVQMFEIFVLQPSPSLIRPTNLA